MDYYFDEDYYVEAKLQQLHDAHAVDGNGNPYTRDSLLQTFAELGLTPQTHYEQYGRNEGLNQNPYFNETEYLEAKVNQLNSEGETDAHGNAYTTASLRGLITSLGMTPASHYERYGAFERDADGNFINPSNAFDANAYYSAKLMEMQQTNPDATLDDLVNTLKGYSMSPVTHYEQYGAQEAVKEGVALVQTVPLEQRVANDPVREVVGDTVPANYNAATAAPTDTGAPVVKPADVGGLDVNELSPAVEHPAANLPVPGDKGYQAPPESVIDTNGHPVIPPSSSDTDLAAGNWLVVNDDGSAIAISPDGVDMGTLPKDSVTHGKDGSLTVSPDLPMTTPIVLDPAVDFSATTGADTVVFHSGVSDSFATTLAAGEAKEVQQIDLHGVTIQDGRALAINGKEIFVNDTGHSVSGADAVTQIYASYADTPDDVALPTGWTLQPEHDDGYLAFEAADVRDKAPLTAKYSTDDAVAEVQTLNLRDIALDSGQTLSIGQASVTNTADNPLEGQELADKINDAFAQLAAGMSDDDDISDAWDTSYHNGIMTFTSQDAGVNQPMVTAKITTPGTYETQTFDLSDVTLAKGGTLSIGEFTYTAKENINDAHDLIDNIVTKLGSSPLDDLWIASSDDKGTSLKFTANQAGDQTAQLSLTYPSSDTAKGDDTSGSQDTSHGSGTLPHSDGGDASATTVKPSIVDGTDSTSQSLDVQVSVPGDSAGIINLRGTEITPGVAGTEAASTFNALDTITGFTFGEDKIVLPTAVTGDLVTGSQQEGQSLDKALGALFEQLHANQAGLLTVPTDNGTDFYVMVNDAHDGFDQGADAVIRLVGVSNADDAATTAADLFDAGTGAA